ncbi:MAG: hypothetical protein AUJ37_04640 [Candidatus Magasanikbacteria bacterium CG1_02_41_34]|uniref:Aldehyde dehydrogenase domain-containing protein n=1 Tax=Candidatus Magasanikbacteria bacterium CG_4_10_14_0_2_um_filter_41_31 TaxID=1974639 RepID=A0A2M7V4P1_9BACT|nr:MAG: hypothetical protein AUJ37_04640 [Candidatus Magasanikbacteria bacterium CG1_02_41_34]PIZ93535.1 MAG: hypothetical protein COX83_01560 [Candidatus Magasanikbacteria bacterium CG_4_10_14_0_2_um_filter_41_31]
MLVKDFRTLKLGESLLNECLGDFSRPDFPIGVAQNLVDGEWQPLAPEWKRTIVNPLTGNPLYELPATPPSEFSRFGEALRRCPKSGRHNAFQNVERYKMLGAVSARAAMLLSDVVVQDYFTRLIRRVMPKSYRQALGEVTVVQKFLENFSGDQVRFLAKGFSIPGDHLGQETRGYRWPYGPVVIITPFNFPLEIPALQLMGALYMGNLPLIKADSKVSIVVEQFIRLLHTCGLPKEDIISLHCTGQDMGIFLAQYNEDIRLVQFTGSTGVAEKISEIMHGRVRIEDSGFDWKILGPDADKKWLDYVAWQCDQDAYAASGQKCSAESILFVHKNWTPLGIIDKMRSLAARRELKDLTIGPVMTWTNEQIGSHIAKVMQIDGAELLFGGVPLSGHSIPAEYGAFQPTAIQVPLSAFMQHFELLTTELFGPFQIVVEYDDTTLDMVLDIMERMTHHLTAAVVSNDDAFHNKVLGATLNGTTYMGMRARTTGAPQNHWFGSAGDPRAAGIGTPEAIISTWSCHREIVTDRGAVPSGWSIPPAS